MSEKDEEKRTRKRKVWKMLAVFDKTGLRTQEGMEIEGRCRKETRGTQGSRETKRSTDK